MRDTLRRHLTNRLIWTWVASCVAVLCIELIPCNLFSCGVFNLVLSSILYSVNAACIFFFINDYLPSRKRRKVMRSQISWQLLLIRKHLEKMMRVLSPFALERLDSIDETTFLSRFEKADLYEQHPLCNSRMKWQYLEDEMDATVRICQALLGTYSSCMTDKELMYVESILNSEFATAGLSPIKHWIAPRERDFDNQRNIGQEIFQLFKHQRIDK